MLAARASHAYVERMFSVCEIMSTANRKHVKVSCNKSVLETEQQRAQTVWISLLLT